MRYACFLLLVRSLNQARFSRQGHIHHLHRHNPDPHHLHLRHTSVIMMKHQYKKVKWGKSWDANIVLVTDMRLKSAGARILLAYAATVKKHIGSARKWENNDVFSRHTRLTNLYQNYKTQGEYQRLMNNKSPKSKRKWNVWAKKSLPLCGFLVLKRV